MLVGLSDRLDLPEGGGEEGFLCRPQGFTGQGIFLQREACSCGYFHDNGTRDSRQTTFCKRGSMQNSILNKEKIAPGTFTQVTLRVAEHRFLRALGLGGGESDDIFAVGGALDLVQGSVLIAGPFYEMDSGQFGTFGQIG